MERPSTSHRFKALCVVVTLVSLAGSDWLARELWLGARLDRIEALRPDGGHYVANDFVTRAYRAEAETAVMFADSSNDSVPASDRDRRTISQMLDDSLADHPLVSLGVSFPGNAVDWISSHLRYLNRRYPGIDYAAIPLNIRWISPLWRDREHNNGSRTSYELYAAGPLLWSAGAELGYRSPSEPFDPEAGPVETVIGPLNAADAVLGTDEYVALHGGDDDTARRRINWLRLGLSYGFELSPADPLFGLVEQIATSCASGGLRCLFFLPPYNLGFIERTDEPVARTLEANLQQVRDYMRAHDHVLLDLSRGLAPEHFHDTVNEHVDEVGRRRIAGCLASALRHWHDRGDPGGPLLACSGGDGEGFRAAPAPATDLE